MVTVIYFWFKTCSCSIFSFLPHTRLLAFANEHLENTMADEMDGFGSDSGDDFGGFGDDAAGSGDDAGGGEPADDMGGFGGDDGFDDEEAVAEVSNAFASLPTPSSPTAADPEPEEEEVSVASKGPKITGEKSGWMKMLVAKKGLAATLSMGKKWKERWFVLKDGMLEMRDLPGSTKKESLEMSTIKHVEKEEAGDGCKFSIISTKQNYFFFHTRSSRDCQEWKDSIELAKSNVTRANFSAKSNSHMLF